MILDLDVQKKWEGKKKGKGPWELNTGKREMKRSPLI